MSDSERPTILNRLEEMYKRGELKPDMTFQDGRELVENFITEQAARDEAEAEAQIRAAGCDPYDPDSHDWRKTSESHTPDGHTVGYECARCGAQDSS